MKSLDEYLTLALKLNATDIHLCEGAAPRIRIENRIETLDAQPLETGFLLDALLLFANKSDSVHFRTDFENGKDLDFAFGFSNKRIRVNIYKTAGGISAALRIIPAVPLEIKEIGLPERVIDICSASRGIFFITGASGSGKSTTLAAMVRHINETRKCHIITIEDPIEYIIPSKNSIVSHREVGRHSLSFYNALRSSLREDPNVIVLGEMRDIETTRTAIELAETGHLVFATLHTRNAASSVDRIISQFPAEEQRQIRLMLADNILGVLSQNILVRQKGGLVAAYELMLPNAAIRNLIREGKIFQMPTIIQTSMGDGMITMIESLTRLAERGVITMDEALRVSQSKDEFLQYVGSGRGVMLRK